MEIAQNLGATDRAIRFVLGYLMLMLFVFWPFTGNELFLAVSLFGLVPLLTAIEGVCPLYLPLSLSTVGPKQAAA